MLVEPYLMFDGRCDEALTFYKSAIGAEVTAIMRYKDSPDPHPPGMLPPGFENKVMHSVVRIGQTSIMASDGQRLGPPRFDGFALTLAVKTDAEAERLFAALSDGGKVTMPMGPTFFSTRFGMLSDRFGVPWMVIVLP